MIEAAFNIAQNHIDEFKNESGRFPSREEFSEWTELHKEDLYSRYLPSLFLSVTDFPEDAIDELGEPPKDSYVLACWRNEWYEYYAPWNKTSTLEFNPKNYYILGGAIKDGILLICIGLIFLLVSVGLWRKPAQLEKIFSINCAHSF
ncbi:MAG: hypothetical protein EOO48_13450 [Flavobacterium sp.]|nr:MAG: hypothetical protein EOO48_13450 [Flavobacterium sp.]